MTEILLIIAAMLLVAFGGLSAAIDAAYGVTSRADLAEMATEGRRAAKLQRIADDLDAHVNAIAFIRVLVEVTAAVLVTVAFTIMFENIWWAMLAAAVLMTGVTFVLVGASPRAFGRQRSEAMIRGTASIVRGVRVILGPLAQALVVIGNRVTPGTGRSSFTSEDQLLSMVDEAASNDLIEEDDRDLIHSVFDFTDQFVRAETGELTKVFAKLAQATFERAVKHGGDDGAVAEMKSILERALHEMEGVRPRRAGS